MEPRALCWPPHASTGCWVCVSDPGAGLARLDPSALPSRASAPTPFTPVAARESSAVTLEQFVNTHGPSECRHRARLRAANMHRGMQAQLRPHRQERPRPLRRRQRLLPSPSLGPANPNRIPIGTPDRLAQDRAYLRKRYLLGHVEFLSQDVNLTKVSTSENPRSFKCEIAARGGLAAGEFRKRRVLGQSPARFAGCCVRGFP